MKNLSLDPLVDNTDPDFINGKIVDNVTLPNEHINQDMIQFFQRLADITSTTPNNLFDNEQNGYQLFEALNQYIIAKSYRPTQRLNYDFTKQDFILDGQPHILNFSNLLAGARAVKLIVRVENEESMLPSQGTIVFFNKDTSSVISSLSSSAVYCVGPHNIIQSEVIVEVTDNKIAYFILDGIHCKFLKVTVGGFFLL